MILTTNTKKIKGKNKERLVGMYIPANDFNLLSLYAINKGVSKSIVLKEILMDNLLKKVSKKKLIENLCRKINTLWAKEHLKKKGKSLTKFKQTLQKELQHKLPPSIIDEILKDEKNC